MSELEPQDCTITIRRDEDWNDAFFLMNGTRPLDLTNTTLELFIRPAFGHSTQIKKLTSAGDGAEIIIDDAALGAAHIFVPEATVVADIPATTVAPWAQFLRVVDLGGTITEFWRGPMYVLPGRDTA